MTAKQHQDPSEEEVLLAFSVEPTHDRKTLEHYLSEYPAHAKALIDCSIELILDTTRGGADFVGSEDMIERSWRTFQSAVRRPDGEPAVNPFATLSPTAFKSLARKLGVNNLLLIRLRDRAIDAATIPRRFVQGLAMELGATTEGVMSYLRNPPTMASGHSFRSSTKPTVSEQISFEKAIETSQLTPAQRDALRALQD